MYTINVKIDNTSVEKMQKAEQNGEQSNAQHGAH